MSGKVVLKLSYLFNIGGRKYKQVEILYDVTPPTVICALCGRVYAGPLTIDLTQDEEASDNEVPALIENPSSNNEDSSSTNEDPSSVNEEPSPSNSIMRRPISGSGSSSSTSSSNSFYHF